MKMKVEATLQWIRPEDGGRQMLPLGPKYSTVARFESQKEPWLKEAWSLVIEFAEQPDASLSHQVKVGFLVDDAPNQFLAEGNAFELMEGSRVVAKGKVTSTMK